jgi:hypothetical protein
MTRGDSPEGDARDFNRGREDTMSGNTLGKSLADWIGATLNEHGNPGREHCFDQRTRFRIPGAGRVDLLTIRHDRGTPDRFRIDLWNILPRTITQRDADAMMRRIHAFEAWYSELREHAGRQGFDPKHRLSVCGNLVGPAIRRSPLIRLLSHWGSAFFFWTWKRDGAGIDVQPAYGPSPALGALRGQLKGLLDHLPWTDAAEIEEPLTAPKIGRS